MDKLKDSAERIWWTALSGALAVLAQVQIEFEEVLTPLAIVAINALFIWARRRLDMLPNPGEGLPGATIQAETSAPNPPPSI